MFWRKKKIEEPIEPVKSLPDWRATYMGFKDKADLLLDIYTDRNDEESVTGLAKMINTIFTAKTQAMTIDTIKRGLIMNGRSDLAEIFVDEIIRQASSDLEGAKNEAYFSEPCVKPSDLTR